MLRIVSGVTVGFFSWVITWVGIEKILSAIWPESYGAHQLAFEAAVDSGGPFRADSTLLLIHIVIGSIVSVMAGFLASHIAREHKRASLILGCLLVALGLAKAVLSWPYVPLWYHAGFTILLLPMTMMGGKMKPAMQVREQ